MKSKKIRYPFFVPVTGKTERKYVDQVLRNNYLNEGDFTRIFENEIRKKLKVKYVVTTTSCTIAMFLALKALGIKSGDEVIVPDFTFAATPNAVDLCNAKSILADSKISDLNIDADKIKKLINRKTKAIIPVHVSGRPSNMLEIKKICRRKKIFIIEDAAEAFMSKYKGKYLGTFGEIGCFSLTASKIITSGQGGFIVTNNNSLYKKIKKLKNQGIQGGFSGGNTKHISLGYNFKYTNIQSAIALAQVKTVNQRIKKTRLIYNIYKKQLKNIPGLKVMPFDIKGGSVPLWSNIWCKKRNELRDYLRKNNVESRMPWYPLHTQKPYKTKKKFPNSTQIFKKHLWLPSSLTLKYKDIIYICKLIKNFYRM